MTQDKSKRDDSEEVAPAREGDVLGLGGTIVPKSPTDRETDSPEDPDGRGHMGVLGETEEAPDKTGAFRRSSGATGIDMGAGGGGTDID